MRDYQEDSFIRVEPSFLIFLCVCYYFDPVGCFWPFLLGLCAHEGGHLLALAAVGCPVRRLRLTALGAQMQTEACSYLKEALAAAAGPAMNLLLFVLCAKPAPIAALVNLALLCYNLLPFYPLDGGRLLRCVLHILLPDEKAARAETALRLCFAAAAILSAVFLTARGRGGLMPCAILLLITARVLHSKKE